MNLKTKIYGSFGLLFVFLIACVLYQSYVSRQQSASLIRVKEESLVSMHLADRTKMLLSEIQIQQVLMLTNLMDPKDIQKTIDTLVAEFKGNLTEYVILNPDSQQTVDVINDQLEKALHNEKGDMQVIIDINKSIDDFARSNYEEITLGFEEVVSSNKLSDRVLGIIQTLSLILCIIAAYLLIRSFNRPIRDLTAAAQKIAEGDLSKPLVNRNNDEIGILAQIFEQMRLSLSSFIEAAQVTANQVASSSQMLTERSEQTTQQITGSVQAVESIAEGANIQMLSMSETARAMEEISLGIQRISESTTVVSELSISTEQEAKQGNELLSLAVTQMHNITDAVNTLAGTVGKLDEHSNTINQITEVIKGISVQTNLLSLNASIEAARAGEHGKGFAVVAQEISKLAAQSKVSSEHINEIITMIQQDTQHAVVTLEDGVEQVRRGQKSIQLANDTFASITRSTTEISLQIQETSAASEELSASSEEVSASINELEHIAKKAQDNSRDMVETSKQQLESMLEMGNTVALQKEASMNLKQYISGYKVS